MNGRRTLTGFIPTYSSARIMLEHINGVSVAQYRAIQLYVEDELRQEYPSPLSIKRLAEPLTTESRRIAHKILAEVKNLNQDSGSLPNSKFPDGFDSLCKVHHLTALKNGRIVVTKNGKRFLKGDEDYVARLDKHEGFFFMLEKLVQCGPQRTSQVKELFDTFRFKTIDPERLKTGYHVERLKNLLDRGLVIAKTHSHEHKYYVTREGQAYLQRNESKVALGDMQTLEDSVHNGMRARLLEGLRLWDPFEFECLIACLLEEMGYVDVNITKKSNDKGVDIEATLRQGFSKLPVAVQVKRYSKDVGRDVLDRLRGSLHRFHAVQGVIVCTAGFAFSAHEASKEMGAMPIRLIDGEELIDLFLERDMVESNSADGSLRFRPRVTSYVKTRMTQN